MDTLVPPLVTTRIVSDSSKAVTTAEYFERHLVAVIQLFEHNTEYLQPFERPWIEHIISEAVSARRLLPGLEGQALLQPINPIVITNSLHEKLNIHEVGLNSRSPLQTISEDDNGALFTILESLKSAINLLSCCYDRWSWLQSLSTRLEDQRNIVGHLQEPLGRRKQSQKLSSTIVPQVSELVQSPQRQNTTSSGSSRVNTTSMDGSENSLPLAIDDTIDKWRQNAEHALNEATTRSGAGSVLSYQEPSRQLPSRTYTYQPYRKEPPTCVVSDEANVAKIHTCSPKSKHTQTLSTSSQTSSQCVDPFHSGVRKAPGDHYMQDPSSPQRFAGHRALQPAFSSTLYDSFDKEAINDASMKIKRTTSDYGSENMVMCSSCLRYGCRCGLTIITPVTTQIVHKSTYSQLGISSRNNSNAMASYGLPSSMSTISVQLRTEDEKRNPRSRGRRWLEQLEQLEQQSDRNTALT